VAIYWISFSDPEKPVGSQLQGVVVVEADDPDAGLAHAHSLGIDAGSKVFIEDISERRPPLEWFDHLLSAKESRDLNRLLCKQAQAREDEDYECDFD
jgi:hypothetical protein